jgi:hypothetical protein
VPSFAHDSLNLGALAIVLAVVYKAPAWGLSVLALEKAWEERRERRAKAKEVNAPGRYGRIKTTNDQGGPRMTDFDSLSDVARLARMSLSDHPNLNTPEAISTGPYGVDQIDASDIADGLAELAATDPPSAVALPGGGWRLLSSE